jgi:hypothetical protein
MLCACAVCAADEIRYSEIIGVEQVEKNDWNLTNKRWYTGGIVGIE